MNAVQQLYDKPFYLYYHRSSSTNVSCCMCFSFTMYMHGETKKCHIFHCILHFLSIPIASSQNFENQLVFRKVVNEKCRICLFLTCSVFGCNRVVLMMHRLHLIWKVKRYWWALKMRQWLYGSLRLWPPPEIFYCLLCTSPAKSYK